MRYLLFISLFLVSLVSSAQFSEEEQKQIDSLNLIINDSLIEDTIILAAYLKLSEIFVEDNKKDKETCLLAIKKAKSALLNNEDRVVEGTLNKFLAAAHNNLGFILMHSGDLTMAIDYYYKGLKIYELIEDSSLIANTYLNIGLVNLKLEEFNLAINNFNKGLSISKNSGNLKSLSAANSNIARYYYLREQLDSAKFYLKESINIDLKLKDLKEIALGYNNLGAIFSKIAEYDSSLFYYDKSLLFYEEVMDTSSSCLVLSNISRVYNSLGNLTQAENYANRAVKLAITRGDVQDISACSESSFFIHKKLGNYKEALEMYELHIQMRDSIKNEETQKAAIRQQTKYEFEKAQLVKEQVEKEQARVEAEKVDRRNSLQYSIIFVAILAVFGLVLALGKVQVSPKVAEGLIFFAFLILFEFLLVLSDPYVDSMTNGEPMYKLLANALLAGLIFPLHAFFERTLKVRLIRNKRNG